MIGWNMIPDQPSAPDTIGPRNPCDADRLPDGAARRVLVIGGGVAGLSAALELAERGYQVTLKEAAAVLGGRLHTRDERLRTGAFRVEHGLHMWFWQYYNSFDIIRRLGRERYFRPLVEVYYQFKTYKPEIVRSVGPYPFNVLNVVRESPNLSVLDVAGARGALGELVGYNHDLNYRRFDDETFDAWGRRTRVNRRFWDIVMGPVASVTLNDPARISAAEMLLYMHLFFLGHPKAFRRSVATVDHGTALIDPWGARLRSLGACVEVSAPVAGLRLEAGRAVGEVGSPGRYDAVVLASDVGGLHRILAGSVPFDAASAAALTALRARLDRLAVAPAYHVLRGWFDKPIRRRRVEAVIETPQHRPINLIAIFSMLEEQSAAWARERGGSVVELHLYNTPWLGGLGADVIYESIRGEVEDVLPELRGARALDFSLGAFQNFTSLEVGQGKQRPTSDFALLAGVRNLALAGDWVHTRYPSALLERAVSTGREAANHILFADRVREAPLATARKHGPGLFPRFG
ncbi:FAD-dependent oxidoreductase [Sorangium sp. So ce590]|uniref:FAD-dependent oxidoreductase n=1 Tax=Sorangium sp. So ce590 TaxID=3133317 RepID=UPI003F5E57C0